MLFLLSLFLGSPILSPAPKCEVCINFFTNVLGSLSDSEVSDPEKVREAVISTCATAKGKEHRLCNALGALPESLASTMGSVGNYGSIFPPDKVCEKLSINNAQICAISYDKTIDLKSVKLSKLPIKQLRKILSNWNAEDRCMNCPEKSDFVRAVINQMPKYDPEAWKIRQENNVEL